MPTIKRNSQGSNNVNRAHAAGIIQDLVERIGSPYKLTLRNVKGSGGYYALTGNNNEFLGFAVVSNNPNSVRHLELIATRSGYGDMLMRRVISNATNNKKNVTLEAAANRLVNYYKKYGFQLTGQGRLMKLPLS
jgi:L-amino acid N-acyltransferase YncA